MAEGDLITRLDDWFADVVANRAVPGLEPGLEARWIPNLIPGITQRWGQAETDDLGRVMSNRTSRVPGR
jgi:hypothetical protein